MDIQSLMSTHVCTVESNRSAVDAARLMKDEDVGCLVVLEGDAVKGIITDRDLVVGCLGEGHDSGNCVISDHMSSPAMVAAPSADAADAAHIMSENSISRIPIVDAGKLVGIVSFSDIALALDIMKGGMDETMHDLLMGVGGARSAG